MPDISEKPLSSVFSVAVKPVLGVVQSCYLQRVAKEPKWGHRVDPEGTRPDFSG